MTCYILAEIQINNRDRYADYEAGFLSVLQAHQGELIAVDEALKVLEGQAFVHRTVILRFNSEAQAKTWYESEEYQALIAIRQAASQANISMIRALD